MGIFRHETTNRAPKEIPDPDEVTAALERELYELEHPPPVFQRPKLAAVWMRSISRPSSGWPGSCAGADQRGGGGSNQELVRERAGVHYDYQRTESGWDDNAPPPGRPCCGA